MSPLARWIAPLVLVVTTSVAAQDQHDFVPKPAAPDDRAFAAAFARALGDEPGEVEGVAVHERRGPLPSGTLLEGEGVRVSLEGGGVLLRVVFPSREAADAYASNLPDGAATLGSDRVTLVLTGPGAERGAARLTSEDAGAPLDVVLQRLDRREIAREEQRVTLTVPRGARVGQGVRVTLGGAVLLALRFGTAERAQDWFGAGLQGASERRVADNRGEYVMLVDGADVADAKAAARLLRAAAAAADLEAHPRAHLGTLAPLDPADAAALGRVSVYAALSLVASPLYEATARVIRVARAKGDVRQGEFQHWFCDPDTKNHVAFRSASGLCGEVKLISDVGVLSAVARGEEAVEREKRYLFALLEALDVPPPPPAKGMIELLEQGGR